MVINPKRSVVIKKQPGHKLSAEIQGRLVAWVEAHPYMRCCCKDRQELELLLFKFYKKTSTPKDLSQCSNVLSQQLSIIRKKKRYGMCVN